VFKSSNSEDIKRRSEPRNIAGTADPEDIESQGVIAVRGSTDDIADHEGIGNPEDTVRRVEAKE